jgi:hypothetical protein
MNDLIVSEEDRSIIVILRVGTKSTKMSNTSFLSLDIMVTTTKAQTTTFAAAHFVFISKI